VPPVAIGNGQAGHARTGDDDAHRSKRRPSDHGAIFAFPIAWLMRLTESTTSTTTMPGTAVSHHAVAM
jgi:hypothetical protein